MGSNVVDQGSSAHKLVGKGAASTSVGVSNQVGRAFPSGGSPSSLPGPAASSCHVAVKTHCGSDVSRET